MVSSYGIGSLSLNSCYLRLVLLFMVFAQNQFAALGQVKKETSQIEGPTLNNSYGFKVTCHNLQDAKALHEVIHAMRFNDVCINILLNEFQIKSISTGYSKHQHINKCITEKNIVKHVNTFRQAGLAYYFLKFSKQERP